MIAQAPLPAAKPKRAKMCARCGVAFMAKCNSQKFCSIACGVFAASNKRQQKHDKCLNCGKSMDARVGVKYCGRPCYEEANRRIARERSAKTYAHVERMRMCPGCNTYFDRGNTRRRYCSLDCRTLVEKQHRPTARVPSDRLGSSPSNPTEILDWIAKAPRSLFDAEWVALLTEQAMEDGGIAFVARALVAVRERYRNRA